MSAMLLKMGVKIHGGFPPRCSVHPSIIFKKNGKLIKKCEKDKELKERATIGRGASQNQKCGLHLGRSKLYILGLKCVLQTKYQADHVRGRL